MACLDSSVYDQFTSIDRIPNQERPVIPLDTVRVILESSTSITLAWTGASSGPPDYEYGNVYVLVTDGDDIECFLPDLIFEDGEVEITLPAETKPYEIFAWRVSMGGPVDRWVRSDVVRMKHTFLQGLWRLDQENGDALLTEDGDVISEQGVV